MRGRLLTVVASLLLVLLVGLAPTSAVAKPEKPTGTVLVSTRAGGKPVSAELELFAILDLGSVGSRQVSMGQLTRSLLQKAMTDPGPARARARTDARGRAELQGLPRGLYQVRVRRGPARVHTVLFALPSDGSRLRVAVDLTRGTETIRGRLELKEGATFRGHVWLRAESQGVLPYQLSIGLGKAPVAEDGSFTIREVPYGAYLVSAVDDRHGIVAQDMVVAGTGDEPTLSVFKRTATVLQGRVTAATTGKPIAAAEIRMPDGRDTGVRTDADGRFRVPVSGGVLEVVAHASGFAPGKSTRADWEPPPDGMPSPDPLVMPVEVALERPVTVRGRVRRADGRTPLPQVSVVVMSIPEPDRLAAFAPQLAMRLLMQRMQVRIVHSDPRGAFEASGLAPGKYVVAAFSRRWVSRNMTDPDAFDDIRAVKALAPGAVHEETIELVRTAVIEGRVRTAQGKGAKGVVVVASGGGFASLAGSSTTAITGDGGAYRLEGVVPGHAHTVAAFSRKRSPGEAAPVTPAAGRTSRADIVLPDAAWLDVRVVLGRSKEAQRGAMLVIQPDVKTAQASQTQRHGVTDDKGRVRLGPLPHKKPLRLLGMVKGVGTHSQAVAAFAAGGTRTLEIDLGAGKLIEGRLQLPTGARAADVTLEVRDLDLGSTNGSGSVRPDGAFRWVLRRKEPVRVTATLRHRGTLYYGETETTGDSYGVVVAPGRVRPDGKDGSWLLSVRGPDGKPVPRARVTQVTRSEHERDRRLPIESPVPEVRTTFKEVEPVTDGLAWMRPERRRPPEARPPGAQTWFVVHSATDAKEKALPYGAAITGPFTAHGGSLELRMPSERTVRGTCVDADGKPLPRVMVYAWPWTWEAGGPEPGPYMRTEGVHATAVTDAQGAFTLRGLGALAYKLTLRAPPDYLPVKPRVLAKTETQAAFRFVKGRSVVLTFLDAEGKPAAGVDVRLSRDLADQPHTVSGTTDKAGMVTLRGLRVGERYDLRASLYVAGPGKLEDIERAAWLPTAETFRFKADAGTLFGRVLTPEGKPLPGAHVWYQLPGRGRGQWRSATKPGSLGVSALRTLEDHEFRVYLLDEKRCYLWVHMDAAARPPERTERARWKKEVVEAVGGAKVVELRCEPGPAIHVEVPDYRPGFVALNVLLQDLATPDADARENVEQKPRTVFYGVRPDRRYLVYVLTSDGKRCGRVRDVRVSSEPVRVRLEPAGKVHGKLTIPKGLSRFRVQVAAVSADGIALAGKVRDGAYEVTGLANEGWYVTVWAEEGDKAWVAEHDFVKPGRKDLVLKEDS